MSVGLQAEETSKEYWKQRATTLAKAYDDFDALLPLIPKAQGKKAWQLVRKVKRWRQQGLDEKDKQKDFAQFCAHVSDIKLKPLGMNDQYKWGQIPEATR
jgi:hypothetical protein